MRIEKKKPINFIKKLLKTKSGKYQTLVLATSSWTKFFRHSKLLIGLSKSNLFKSAFIKNYNLSSLYLSKWNSIYINIGIATNTRLFNKSLELDNSILNNQSIEVKNYWDSGNYVINRKSGSKKFIIWESKNKIPNKLGVRDMNYLRSYNFSLPCYKKLSQPLRNKDIFLYEKGVMSKTTININNINIINYL